MSGLKKLQTKCLILSFCLVSGLLPTSNSYAEIAWETTYGPVGATIESFLSQSQYIYLGTSSGLYRSYNKGQSFSAVYPSNSEVITALLDVGEDIILRGSSRGIARSIDGGESWEQTQNPFQGKIHVLFKDSRGFAYAGGKGVVVSKDNGKTWKLINKGLPDFLGATLIDIHMFTEDSQGNIYAGSGASSREARGLYKLPNGSDSWGLVNNFNTKITGLTYLEGTLYVVHAGITLAKSEDNGETWTEINTLYISKLNGLKASINNELLAITSYGFLKSRNQGKDWVKINSIVSGFGEDVNGDIYVSRNELLYKTVDRGNSWELIGTNLYLSKINYLYTSKASLFAFNAFGFSELKNDSNDWQGYSKFIGGVSHYTDFLEQNNVIYTGIVTRSPFIYKSLDGGSTWGATGEMIPPLNEKSSVPHTLILKGNDLFVSTRNGVFLSSDNGRTWGDNPILIDGTGDIVTNSAGAIFVVSTLDTRVKVTRDNGKNWREEYLGSKVNDLTVGSNKKTVYASVKGNLLDSASYDGIYKTSDNGGTWEFIGNGLPSADYKFIFSSKKGLLFTFASHINFNKLFVSSNGGKNWQEAVNGLPTNIKINYIAEDENGENIYLATEGAGVFKWPVQLDTKPVSNETRKGSLNIIFLSIYFYFLFNFRFVTKL